MFNIALYEPEIPPNTGNIIRLCANTGCTLHLVEPLGFSMDEKALRRAGLDYHEYADVQIHADYDTLINTLKPARVLGISTRGTSNYADISYSEEDLILFGPETRGLPDDVLFDLSPEHRVRIPMKPGVRSLNLSNAVAVVAYEAWRQIQFAGS